MKLRDRLLKQPPWMCWESILSPLQHRQGLMPCGIMASPRTSSAGSTAPYTAAEDRTIRRLHAEGWGWLEIAVHLGRGRKSVGTRGREVLRLEPIGRGKQAYQRRAEAGYPQIGETADE